MAAKAKVRQTTKSKSRSKKTGGDSGYVQCNMCKGTGRIKRKK